MPTTSRDSGFITLRFSRRLALVLVSAVAALGLVGVGIAGGARLAQPTAVAVVNYNGILSNLDQRKAKWGEIVALEARLQQEGRAMVAEAEAMFEQMKAYDARAAAGELDAAGEAEYTRLRDEFRRKDLQIQAWDTRSKRQLDWEKSYALEDLFAAINTEIDAVAQARGFDIVLSDDSDAPIGADRRQPNAEAQLAGQMRQRRILFSDRTVDITQDVVDRLNNAWNAGR